MPFESVPYASPTMLDPGRSSGRIIDLMMRQGDVAARGAAAQGQIWGNAVNQLGQIGGQYVAQRQEQKAKQQEEQRQAQIQAQHEAAFSEVLGSWDSKDPESSVKRLASVVGTEPAIKFGTGMMQFETLLEKNKKGEVPTLNELKDGVVAAHILKQNAPGLYAQIQPSLLEHYGPALQTRMGIDLSKASPEEIEKGLETLGAQWGGENKPEKPTDLKQQYDAALTAGDSARAAQILKVIKDTKEAGTTIRVDSGRSDDVKEAVSAMKEGTVPPLLPGRATKEYLATLAEARRQGFDLASANEDWTATQKHLATLNGAQQTRLRQAVDVAYHSLDVIDDLAKQWQGGKFPVLNKAQLAAAKAGTMGPKAQAIATKLEAQITDVTSELGNVYMGGNSPTDHALQLAAKNLSADWTLSQLQAATELSRQNLKIRSNSMKNVGVAGASENNPYAPKSDTGIDPEVQKRLDKLKGL